MPLRLLYCCPPAPVRHPRLLMPPPEYRAAVLAQGRHWLNDAARAVRVAAPEVALSTDMRAGQPADILIGESAAARLVVVGARGTGGFRELLVGSTADELAAHGHCPVVVYRGSAAKDGADGERPVVVGVDGSPLSDAAVGFAFAAAIERQAPLVAVHTWLDVNTAGMWAALPSLIDWPSVHDDEVCVLENKLAPWRKKYLDTHVRTVVRRELPEHALRENSSRAQLVVVGSRGRGTLAAIGLGSVSHTLVRTAECPVVVVRPQPVDVARHRFRSGVPAA